MAKKNKQKIFLEFLRSRNSKEKVINVFIDTKEIKNYKTFHNDIKRIVDKIIRKLDTIK